MLTHLEAKKNAAEVTRRSPSLLRQFLSQSEPPQEPVPSGEVDEEETASESGVVWQRHGRGGARHVGRAWELGV